LRGGTSRLRGQRHAVVGIRFLAALQHRWVQLFRFGAADAITPTHAMGRRTTFADQNTAVRKPGSLQLRRKGR